MSTGLRVAALAAVAAAAFVLDVALMHAMTSLLHMNDFGKFYYSAQAFLDGGDMYAPNLATNLQFVEAPDLQLLNMNPPHFHLLVLPLARLAPDVAVTIWLGASLTALIVSLLVIGREVGFTQTGPAKAGRPVRGTGLLAVVAGSLAFAGTQSFFATGNLSLILLFAVTLCWIAARRGEWVAAGVWLGLCISIKPFLLIFAPYLALTRRFRALAVAALTATVAFGIGWLIFGSGAHRAWYGALAQSGDWAWEPMNTSLLGIFRRAFDTQPIGTPLVVAPALVKGWLVAAAIVGIVTLVACLRASTDRAFALLLVAAQLISPLGWIYYMWLPAGPVAALARDARRGPAKAGRPVLRRGPAEAGRPVLKTVLVVVAAIGFVWPMPLLLLFRQHAIGTLLIASIYFWATLALWVWLLVGDQGRRDSR